MELLEQRVHLNHLNLQAQVVHQDLRVQQVQPVMLELANQVLLVELVVLQEAQELQVQRVEVILAHLQVQAVQVVLQDLQVQ